ncbi:MAG: protein-export chaperone SecB [Gammaproteobacteria bacterium]|nr:protein-export chaperone SecB [Gammaproteobacteria bacterium]
MTDTAAPPDPATKPKAGNDVQFFIQKVYVKDLSFETPGSPQIFTQQWTPEINLHLQSHATHQGDHAHEVVLSVTVTAKLGDKTAFLVEVQQAGLFTIKGLEKEELARTLGSFCPNVLFPFAREVVSDLVTKGGFPQLLLAPVNFEAIYAHAQKQRAEQPATH